MKKFVTAVYAAIFTICSVFALPENVDGNLTPGPKPKDRPSVALVLAGGGAKGFAHLPVMDLLEEMDIPVDMIVGTSIGSIVGGVYAAGYSTTEILNYFDQVNWTPIFSDTARSPYEATLEKHSLNSNLFSLNFGSDLHLKLGNGLSNGQNVYEMLKSLTLKYPSYMDFNTLPIPFRAVVTNMLTGEAEVISDGDIAEAIRASMSLPSIFQAMEIDGKYYMDGGIRYNLAINVARNMGYDIIIAVDISQKVRDNPEVYSSNPAVAMLNTITISQYTTTQAMYKDAALVIVPELKNYGTLDFMRAKEIYAEGARVLPEYEGKLEEIRKQIYPNDYDENGKRISSRKEKKRRGTYRFRGNMIPTKLEVEGALEADVKLFNHAFTHLYDKELTPDNFSKFMDEIYITGNYVSIYPRVYEEGEETVVKLLLKQKEKKEIKLVTGLEFQQTVSPESMTSFTLSEDVQFRGFTGPGSCLAVGGRGINNNGLWLFYIQPLTSNFFLRLDVDYSESRYSVVPFTDARSFGVANVYSFKVLDSNCFVGFRTDNGNLLNIGGYYNSKSTPVIGAIRPFADVLLEQFQDEYSEFAEIIDENFIARTFGGYLNYTLDKLDRDCFPHSGIYLDTELDLLFPFKDEIFDPSFITTLNLKSAVPLGKKLSINTGLYFATDMLGTMNKNAYSLLAGGFHDYDRRFFPQCTSEGKYGSIKACAELTLQFEPWKQLTIFGGDAVLRLTGTVGNISTKWDRLVPVTSEAADENPLMWSTSAGFGINVKGNYSIYLRLGAASSTWDYSKLTNYGNFTKVMPFFSIDIGCINF
ncbi:MAG: patatin-like phospholipase family protein [Treponema sp.]|nr:patatin-like phospholipase family protein [Candidatus Treponema equifaecale]